MKTLVLAEKPSVGRELARVLGCRQKGEGCLIGDKYIVTWALGHLVTLAAPERYDAKWKNWRLEDLPMLPEPMKTEVIAGCGQQLKAIQALMKRSDVGSLIIATDAGREGELVARWIMEKNGCKKPAQRLWISSQTDKAIREGFAALRPAKDFDHLYHSARARAEADWLVGLNISRALTCHYNAGLNAGRVQTPTLALVVAREEEIKKFVPEPYWTIQLKTKGFTATWRDKKGQSRIFDKAQAEAILAQLTGKSVTVTGVKSDFKLQPPPAAYDLTELQRDANKKYAYSAKETLSLMQRLYENYKALTYPRTDSRYIPDDVVPTLPERLKAVMVGDYKTLAQSIFKARPYRTKYLVNNSKVSDHHAIIPTEQAPMLSAMSRPEANIYDLVVRRFLAVLLPPCEYETVSLTLSLNGHAFAAKGKVMKDPGWRAAYGTGVPGEEEEEDVQSLPAVRSGESLPVLGVELKAGKTTPPPRYTEATLLSDMENPVKQVEGTELKKVLAATSGLGTPATRADIIEKLFKSSYMERQGKQIVPTAKGIQLIALAPAELRSAELTAQWEQRLAQISQGQVKADAFVADMRTFAARLVSEVKNSTAKYVPDNISRTACPQCGQFLLDTNGKSGRQLVCPDRECGYRQTLSKTTNARCPNCHKKLELRGEGDARSFVCICGFREKLAEFEKKKAAAGAGKREVQQYLNREAEALTNNALAEQLAKWKQNH